MNDRGRVSDDLILNHLMLLLQRSPQQEQGLEQFINETHDPASPLFHHWITAEEFGQKYGVPSADVARVTDWLESQGFKVNLVYPNRLVIDFTGTAGQIRRAFHTEIHRLWVNGQAHIANMSDPLIPAELASTVSGIVSLNDFRLHPMLRRRASYTVGNGWYPLVPADLWTIYNFNPAFAAGFSGQGQMIVVVEDTDLYSTADWGTFRSIFGLASAYPLGSLAQVHPPSSPTNNCTDPGVNGDDPEAAIDVEWASAGAPSAAIELASCANTETNWGPLLALQNLLNAAATPPAIVSISYGESESFVGASFNAYINSLYQQAVTAGVSVFVSSGDEGGASSDAHSAYASYGINVSGLTSTPYNVSVGGTDFADYYDHTQTTYWSGTNTANYGSALSYIPEIPWNDSCASVLLGDYIGILPTYGSAGLCNQIPSGYQQEFLTTAAGSGGPSGCATGAPDLGGIVGGTCAGYLKPSWQSGLIGNPNDGVRDIPDVSLFAANGLWSHYYVVCFSDPNNDGASCSGAPSTWTGFGGTSVSSPIMAAIQALVNQVSGSRWGNPNPAYYALAASEYGSAGSTSCNSALGNEVATNCIFYDVTKIPLLYTGTGTGGDNDVPCSGLNCYAPSGTYGVLSTAPQTLSLAWVTDLGSGYTSAPSCTLSGGGGSGATCSASLTGVVTSLALNNGGSGYTSSPTCTLTGGGGSGASCVAYTCPNEEVCALYLYSFGSGYTSAPTCTLSGGSGTGATCTASEGPGIAVSLTAPGSGYTTTPHCVLSGGGGTGGTCAAVGINTSDTYQPAFGAATGWDFATGIGTVNASNLVASFASPAPAFSSSGLAFPPQALDTSSVAQSVTVTNPGTGNLIVLTVTISGTNSSDFAKSADTCTGATVVPKGTCTVSVTFTPSAVGSRSASLNFNDIALNNPQTVSLTGIGFQPSITIGSVNPGSITLVQGGSAQSVAVSLTRNAYSGSVTLSTSALPSGVTATFAEPGTGNAGSISLKAASNPALVSNQTITITASGSRVASVTATFSLTVSAPSASSIAISSVSPGSITLVQGGSAQSVTVNLTRNVYTGSVTLSTSALPSGVTATFTQPGMGNSGSISLSAASNAALVNNLTITITASGTGVASATATFTLTT
jgi:hypothetical protein